MANQRIEMTNIRHILRLLLKGTKKRAISRMLGVGRNTIERYIKDFTQTGKSLEELYNLKPSELNALLKKDKQLLSERYEQLKPMFPSYLSVCVGLLS